jgi:hypothetical protein
VLVIYVNQIKGTVFAANWPFFCSLSPYVFIIESDSQHEKMSTQMV